MEKDYRHVCYGCLPKYKVDDSDKLQHQHQIAKRDENGSGADK
jgi:hypothetical protein